MFMADLPLNKRHAMNVDRLDRLINLDYANQYEKFLRTVSFGPRGGRRARDLASDALRLCEPRPDPFRAVIGFAQPPIPRRGCARAEGASRADPGAEGVS